METEGHGRRGAAGLSCTGGRSQDRAGDGESGRLDLRGMERRCATAALLPRQPDPGSPAQEARGARRGRRRYPSGCSRGTRLWRWCGCSCPRAATRRGGGRAHRHPSEPHRGPRLSAAHESRHRRRRARSADDVRGPAYPRGVRGCRVAGRARRTARRRTRAELDGREEADRAQD